MICWLQPRLNAPVYNRSCRDNNNPFFWKLNIFAKANLSTKEYQNFAAIICSYKKIDLKNWER
jgi:hypothetical protein